MLTDRPSFSRCSTGQGFTLIEVIGVLAVIALLVAILAPSAIKQMDRAAWNRETTDLSGISNAMVRSILRNRTIPGYTTWSQAAAAEMDLPVSSLTSTPRGLLRAFVIDGDLQINGASLPYVQGMNGASRPISARVMILSSIARQIPVSSGVLNAADFDSVWDASENQKPGVWSGWTGAGDDLRFQRLNLEPLFHRLVLVNVDPINPGRYAIDTNTTLSVPCKTQRVAYFLDETVVNFLHSSGVLDSRELLQDDASFVYQNNRWSRWFKTDDDVVGTFGQFVHAFLQPPAPSDPKFAATQQAIIDEFYSYLWGYAVWAFGDPIAQPPVPPFAGAGENSTPQYPSYTVVNQAQATMDVFTSNLIE